jgi:hypothetical protein
MTVQSLSVCTAGNSSRCCGAASGENSSPRAGDADRVELAALNGQSKPIEPASISISRKHSQIAPINLNGARLDQAGRPRLDALSSWLSPALCDRGSPVSQLLGC